MRDIEAALAAHAPALRRRRIKPACRSTLADANKTRAPEAFEALIPALLERLSPTRARWTKADLRLVDSTLIHPGQGAADWARFQDGKVAAKVHVVFDPKAQVPVFYELTSGNTNDITVAKSRMPVEAGATLSLIRHGIVALSKVGGPAHGPDLRGVGDTGATQDA